MILRVLVALILFGLATDAGAQTRTHEEIWSARARRIADLRGKAPTNLAQDIEREFDVNFNVEGFLLFAYAQSLTRELRLIEDARTDKQLGAPAATAGATSLVSKGGVPAILAFAVEHGAMTQTADETSVTLRGNAVGWLDLLQGQNFVTAYDDDSRFARALRRWSYSFTFDAAPEAPAPSAERPDPEELEQAIDDEGRQLTAYSVRFMFHDGRDPRRADNRASLEGLVQGPGLELLEATDFFKPVLESPDYRGWIAETRLTLSAPGDLAQGDVERILYRRLEVLRQLMLTRLPDFDAHVARFVRALRTFDGARTEWFARLQQRLIVAAELVRNRPLNLPASSTVRLIVEGRPWSSAWDITANAAVTYQDDGTANVPEPREVGGLRDIQIGLQAERSLGKASSCLDEGSGIGRPSLAIEYLSRRLSDDAVVRFAGHDFTVEKGWIHAAQARITIPVKGSGVKIPLSVSIANRTELLREKNVRAHLGVSFDLDVLASVVRR